MLGILQVIKRHEWTKIWSYLFNNKTELSLQIPLNYIFNYYFTGMSERTAEHYSQNLDSSQQHQNHQEYLDQQQYLDSQQLLDQQNLDHQEHQNHRHNDNSVVQGRAWAN